MIDSLSPIRSVAIGSFDGMHVAHKTLIAQADAAVVIEQGTGYLTPGYKRAWYCDKPLLFYPIETIRMLGASAFVERLRSDLPDLERIVVGYDFGFGHGREGNADRLRRLFDGEVIIVDEVRLDGLSVHSRTIRTLLETGEIAAANRLLGRTYRIDGEVIAGQGIGSRELVPTLNLQVRDYQLPAEGVYASRTRIGKQWYLSVSFTGHRRTTDGTLAVETHIIDRDIGQVSGRVWIAFEAYVRPNKTFSDLASLKHQIMHDIAEVRKREE